LLEYHWIPDNHADLRPSLHKLTILTLMTGLEVYPACPEFEMGDSVVENIAFIVTVLSF